MTSWRTKGRGGTSGALDAGSAVDGDVSLPLGPGEWDDPLGLPLCVVCQNVRKLSAGYINLLNRHSDQIFGRPTRWSRWTRTMIGASRTLTLFNRISGRFCYNVGFGLSSSDGNGIFRG